MLIDAFMIVFALLKPFILCYFATYVSHSCLTISDAVYHVITWYELPLSLRKGIGLIVLRSQSPAHFTGFKVIRCTLATFSAVSEKMCAIQLKIAFKLLSDLFVFFHFHSLSARLRLITLCFAICRHVNIRLSITII